MAFPIQRSLRSVSPVRYLLFPFPGLLFSSISSPTLPVQDHSNETHNSSTLSERHVLEELSNLLPMPAKSVIPRLRFPKTVASVGTCLSPEERLRGVFLQKLKSKPAIHHALTCARVNVSLDVISNVLNHGNLGGEAMVQFFDWAVKQPGMVRDIGSYNVLIRALGRRKYVDFVLRVVQGLRGEGVQVNSETFWIVMDTLIRARRVHKAIEMFGNCDQYGFEKSNESLNVLLRCLCERSHVGAANSFLNSVKGKVPFDAMTYNVVIGGWSRFGRVGEIERLLEEMIGDGVSPDCLTYSYVLEGLGRAGRVEDSVKIFDSMEEKGCSRDTAVYNAMISNLVAVGDLNEAVKYYRCMLGDNCDPNMVTYLKLVSAFIKARKVSDALEIFNEMLDRGSCPTTGSITHFIKPLCSFGPPHAAMMIYTKSRKVGCKISVSAYKLLLMRLSRFGKCGMMLDVWDDMIESGYPSDVEVFEYIINGLCNNGQLKNAVLVMEDALQKGFCPSKLIVSKLNNKLLASNNVERAYKLFLKIKSARHDDNARRFWRANGWHF